MAYVKVREGVYYHQKMGRMVKHEGYSTAIYWSRQMLDYLRRHFATTTNEELAGCLGVGQRTVVRKARELGLRKDQQWLRALWDDHRMMAQSAARRKGNPGTFRKGVRNNPAGEFKPCRKPTEEEIAKRSASMRRWYRHNPDKASAKSRKAWETRRRRLDLEGAL